MAELDLIPSEYRIRLRMQRWLIVFTGLAAAVLAATVVPAGAFAYLSVRTEGKIEKLQQRELIASQHRQQLVQLKQQKVELSGQLELLAGLHRGAAAQQMFVSVDRALQDGDVWFLRWQFRRAGVRVDKEDNAVNTGYIVVAPRGAGARKQEAWRIETHMTVKGQARDHSALSSFVRRLLEQPEIDGVRVLRTSLSRQTAPNVVDFEVAVVVGGNGRSA